MAVHENPDEPAVATANGIQVTHKIDANGLHIKIVPAP
ncbi:Protein of unknown function [Weissella confusa LBAE C39-2]|nr:Protein of unknown function [Weissella confusa LBAE C39-2]